MSQELVTYEVKERAVWLSFNRPERLNALNMDVVNQLIAGLKKAEQDPNVKVIVLTGTGEKSFCAGADIDRFLNQDEMDQYQFREDFCQLFENFSRCAKPIIGRINGYALGGGFGVAMACDILVASERAKLGTPEINIGLFPMMIMPTLFHNVSSRKKFLEMMFTGDKLSAQEALELGMLNHVVPHEELDQKVQELVDKISAKSSATLKLGRQAFYHMAEMDFHQALPYLRGMLSVNLRTEDAKEGLSAFLEKRKPEWKDK